MDTNKKTARLAGWFYLALAVIAPFGVMYVPSQTIVWGDAAATAEKILSNEFLFRMGVATRLVSQVLFLLVIWALYKLMKPVNGHMTNLMALLAVMSVPIAFLVNIVNMTALFVLKGSFLQSFSPEQVHHLAGIFLRIGSYDIQMVQLYWGLWLFPFGWLVYRSGFIPRILGILLILNGVAYTAQSFTFVLFTEYRSIVSQIAMPFMFLGEIPIIFWLLIKGVKEKPAAGEA